MTTFLFPGQGAQTTFFLHGLPDDKVIKMTIEEASDVLKLDALSLDTAIALESTVNVQLGLLIAATAATRYLEAREIIPKSVAGMSIGSVSAAIAAGSINFADALKIVEKRAMLMEQAYPTGYGMAAIGGLQKAVLEHLTKEADRVGEPLYLTNFNTSTEIVVTGASPALDRLIRIARHAGARRAQRLDVGVPSHCVLLEPVSTALAEFINQYEIRPPLINYVGNRRARVLHDAAAVREELATNVSHPVLWYDSITLLYELGERVFIEVPPGDTLTGLVSSTFNDVTAKAMTNTETSAVADLARRRSKPQS